MNHKKQKFILSLIVIVIAIITYFFEYTGNLPWKTEQRITSENVTAITYLDVGQGDSTLIELQNGEVMLIDCGEREYSDTVSQALTDRGISKIDYLIATHPHSDHIGSMADIINNFEIGTFYMPNATHSSAFFERMLEALDENHVSTQIGKAGDVIFEKNSLKAEILSPVSEKYDNLNDYSIVVRLECGERVFMFMGDAEKFAENQITDNVKCDVLKLGHHGSSTSTGKKFFRKADPSYAIISCGKDNSYGHPHDEVIELLESDDTRYYRTDECGDIVIICDGKNINILEN